ncbi:hypothetical protein JW721_05375 [Candidatus Micrarchaeota archaeon]|nr:hypothetical protein [Candidatus Micrarchaeota archaeon]
MKYANSIASEIECIVFDNPAEADKWIRLKHTGENDGIGTVRWNSRQVSIYNERIKKKPSLALQAMRILEQSSDVPNEIKSRLSEVKTTNMGRLVSDPEVRSFLGIEVEGGIIKSTTSQKEVVKGLTQIARDLLDPKFTVRDIDSKEDRKNYIAKFSKTSKPDTSKKATMPWQAQTTTPKSTACGRSAGRRSSPQKTLIKKGNISVSNKRLANIYSELCKLDISKFTNAVSVLLRVFVELSCDCYIDKYKPTVTSNPKTPIYLRNKINAVVTDMVNRKFADNTICKGIRTSVQDKHNILSIDTLHAYIHNRYYSPTPQSLIAAWDNIEEFMKRMWESM